MKVRKTATSPFSAAFTKARERAATALSTSGAEVVAGSAAANALPIARSNADVHSINLRLMSWPPAYWLGIGDRHRRFEMPCPSAAVRRSEPFPMEAYRLPVPETQYYNKQ